MNYLTLFNEITSNIPPDNKPRLLLHACCAPCLSASLEMLVKHFRVDVFFFNPNISPREEFYKRENEVKRLLEIADFAENVTLFSPEYAPEAFAEAAKGFENEPEGGARCERCFRLRLHKTAEFAAQGGYDFFGTTLTISPHKNAEIINKIGFEAAEIYGVKALPLDLKKREGYKRSTQLSKAFGLYRQNFCGCGL
ncbi:MAG: epoxyqueuosine reductase QueH [Ruminococcus sp.]|jgi:predicted adenine nucleotide alpha hydrolase (AANH) superfamily ATPase|nr:epoxyqueuosine reductase QueH [Ruminococcus sp.]